MKASMLRRLLEQYGIERIYLEPEEEGKRKARIRRGGNKARCYVEGWVEFSDKRVAKRVASTLNGNKIGGKKRSFFAEDLWTIEYLPKFKWDNLTEKLAFDKRMRDEKLRAEMQLSKKKMEFYLEKAEQSKLIMGIRKTKEQKKRKHEEMEEENEDEDFRQTDEFDDNFLTKDDNLRRKDDRSPEEEELAPVQKRRGIEKLNRNNEDRIRRKFRQREPINAQFQPKCIDVDFEFFHLFAELNFVLALFEEQIVHCT
eukprot:TRINITY_DN7598_c0_g1_i6.p2 TRINITY_DN7598_c0_g1~~TRINITY_DN7598_c0_g1_i6.p2  ORF type:complete len:256 (+),score=22.95 TRINITY_DN7598_c0_g1_i6:474-1241(+)